MPNVKLIWTPQAEAAFADVRIRAANSGKLDTLLETHNEIVLALSDLELALQKGELLFKTRKANGEVRL